MRLPPRPLAALLLAAILALSSVTMAVARHAPKAAGMVVLCTAEGTAELAVDVRGRPLPPAHPCPDCLGPSLALLPAPALPQGRAAARRGRAPRGPGAAPAPARPSPSPPPRGPPAPV